MTSLVIAKKNIQEIIADKRTVALIFGVPLILITLIYFVLTSIDIPITVGYSGTLPDDVITDNVTYVEYDNSEQLVADLKNEQIDGAIEFGTSKASVEIPSEYQQYVPVSSLKIEVPQIKIITRGTDPIKEPIIQSEVMDSIAVSSSQSLEASSLQNTYGLDDYMIVFVIEFVIFFLTYIVVGMAFLKERKQNTLQRILTYNISRFDVVLGYLLGFGVVALIQTTAIQLYVIYVLNIYVAGNIILSALVNVLFAFVAISIASLLSTLAKSEFQIMQFIPLIIIPQLIFSGILPYDGWYLVVSYIFPITWAFKAQNQLLLVGDPNVSGYIGILFGYIVLFSIINLLILKKTRNI